MTNGKIFEFGDFQLIPGEELLLRQGEPVALNPKAFRVLTLLAERSGHLIEKSEIVNLVWADTFVEEGSLSRAIFLIRHALGETSEEKFIQTVPKRGYRFVVNTSVFDASTINGRVSLPVHSNERLAAKSSLISKLRGAAALAAVAAVILVGFVLYAALGAHSAHNGGPLADHGTKSEEAYRLYLQAANLSEQRGKENVLKALGYLDQAVALDPEFAPAWASKALFHLDDQTHTASENHRSSDEAVKRALAIDPDLSLAYSVLCSFKNGYEYDFAGAEANCKHAIDLDPASPIARRTYAHVLSGRMRFDDSVAQSKMAIDLQPMSYLNQRNYALALYYARRFEEEDQWKRLIDLNPNDSFNYRRLAKCMARQGKEAEAFEYLIKQLMVEKAGNETVELFKKAFAEAGWRGVATEQIKKAEAAEGDPNAFDLACLYTRLGDKEKAFEYLEKAYQEHHYMIAVLQVEPQLDPLHGDARYISLVKRVEGIDTKDR
jgi:DNA-binding winged helix-turn-helix (wHTH) protein/Tfp pilus assembly protein PilF